MSESRPIITLTSDHGYTDFYVAAVKGAIYAELENIRLVDLSHGVQAFNLHQAAYIIKNAYKQFPQGTIHLIGIDSAFSEEQVHLALKCNGHYFVGSDNGLFSLVFPDIHPEKMVALTIANEEDSLAFPMKDVLVRAACHIARGGTLEVIGSKVSNWKELMPIKPVIASDNSSIRGSVIHIDHFGNVITNITEDLFRKVKGKRDFEINLARGQKIKKIASHYAQTKEEGNLVALFNSSGYLEIAMFRGVPKVSGTAQSLLGVKYRDPVQVIFST